MDKISEAALHFLINSAWQIAAIAIGAAICARLLRNLPPRYRHGMWVACILLCLALPLWGLLDLQSVLPFHLEPQPTVQTSEALLSEPGALAGKMANTAAQTGSLRLEDLLQRRRQPLSAPPSLPIVLAIAYGLFAFYRLGKLWRAWLRTQRLRRTAVKCQLPAIMASVAARCANSFGLKRVSLVFSTQTTTPATIGVFQPLIILPERFYTETSEEILVSVLGHEMAHIARRDFALNLVYEFLCLPVSFHPIANLVKRQIARTRELACDDMVTERLLEPETYARSLLRVAGELVMPSRQALTLGVFDADILEERIMKLTRKTRRPGKRATRLLSICAIGMLCVTGIAISTFSFDLQLDRKADKFRSAADARHELEVQMKIAVDVAQLEQKLKSARAQDRAEAACVAGKSHSLEAIPMLIDMMGDDTPIEFLNCWDEGRWSPALETFKQASPGEQAAIALASMGMPALEPLTNALNDPNSSVRRNAAWAIGELTNMKEDERANAVPALISLLGDSDEWVRMAAAQALGEIRDPRAGDGLIALLGDGQWQPRKTAAWALGEMKEERSVEALCNLLLSDPQPDVRVTSAWALGEIQDKRAIDTLAKALVSDEQAEVRKTTAWALREIQDSKGKILIKLKGDMPEGLFEEQQSSNEVLDVELIPHMNVAADCTTCHTSKEVDIESLKKGLALKSYFKELANKETPELEKAKQLLESIRLVNEPVKADVPVALYQQLKMKPLRK